MARARLPPGEYPSTYPGLVQYIADRCGVSVTVAATMVASFRDFLEMKVMEEGQTLLVFRLGKFSRKLAHAGGPYVTEHPRFILKFKGARKTMMLDP